MQLRFKFIQIIKSSVQHIHQMTYKSMMLWWLMKQLWCIADLMVTIVSANSCYKLEKSDRIIVIYFIILLCYLSLILFMLFMLFFYVIIMLFIWACACNMGRVWGEGFVYIIPLSFNIKTTHFRNKFINCICLIKISKINFFKQIYLIKFNL